MLELWNNIAEICQVTTKICSPFALLIFIYNQIGTFKINRKIDKKTDLLIKRYEQILLRNTRPTQGDTETPNA